MPNPTGEALAFVGDSAHSASPQLGQDANMAPLDARALYLGLRDHPGDLAKALARYAALRRWHVRLYQALSAAFTPFYQSDSRVLPIIRDVRVVHCPYPAGAAISRGDGFGVAAGAAQTAGAEEAAAGVAT